MRTKIRMKTKRTSTKRMIHHLESLADRVFFAEMQLFFALERGALKRLEKIKTIMIDEFQKRQEVIMTVRSKTSPFSMNEMVEEFKAQEALNHLSNETTLITRL